MNLFKELSATKKDEVVMNMKSEEIPEVTIDEINGLSPRD